MAYKDPIKQKEFQRIWQTQLRAKYKDKVLELYGRKCMFCGYDNPLALQLDHIIPIKRKDQTRGTNTGTALWRKVGAGILPMTDFQLLCANCHAIKTHNDLHQML